MKNVTIYSLKIKIVSLQFKIRAIQPPVFFTISLGDTILSEQQVQFKNGLLNKNLSLTAQVSQKEINHFAQVTLSISQKKVLKQHSIGVIKLSFQEFMSSKMKRFNIKNCFDSSAYIQAFLLLLPQRIVEQSQKDVSSSQCLMDIFSRKSSISTVKALDQNNQNEDFTINDCQKQEKQVKQYVGTEIGTQTYDIESLLRLNQKLRENNQKLKQENLYLKTKSRELEEKINNLAKKLEIQQALKGQIQELESKVMQKQFQIASKDQIMATLRQQKQTIAQEMQKIQQKNIKEEFKIETIVAELGKYADTAKKYKSKITTEETKVIIPKIPISVNENLRQSLIKTSRNRKEQLKSLLTSNRSRLNCDQTLDTLKESSIKMLNL